MSDSQPRVIFHVDMDAFYASVEQNDDPSLRGKPVIVGARPGHRGVVSACSYEARRYGVHSAMPVSEAYRLCPNGVYVPVRMGRYQEVSRGIMRIFEAYTPSIQQISVDEAFLDMTGTERLFGPPEQTARAIKAEVRSRTGLTISIGIGPSRFIAKMASDFDKPDGLWIVPPGGEEDFALRLELKDLWGLGKKTRHILENLGVDTVSKLREKDIHWLRGQFGPSAGEYLYRAARGIDSGIFTERSGSHSMSTETTFEQDVSDPELVHLTLLALADEVMTRAYADGLSSSTVTVKLRYSDFTTLSARRTLKRSVHSADQLANTAEELISGKWEAGRSLRLIGLGLGDVKPEDESQPELFEDPDDRTRRVEEAVRDLRSRHGDLGISRASLLGRRRRRSD